MDQPDGRRRERFACLPGLAASAASLSAATELGVEGLQGLGVELADRDGAERGPNVFVEPDTRVACGRLQFNHLEPPVEQRVHCRVSARVAALVDLSEKPSPCLLG